MSRLFSILVFLSFFVPSFAQQMGIGEFLRSARTDLAVTGFDRQLDWFEEKRYRLPWVNELELRTQNNVMLWGRQQYRMRLDFANPLEVRNNNRYFESQQELKSIRKTLVFRQALKDRYLMALRWIAINERLSLLRELEELSRRRVEIQEQQAGSAGFNADTYLEARVDLVSRTADRQETEYELALAGEKMAMIARRPGQLPVSLKETIRPETIALLSDTLSSRAMVTGIQAQIKSTELAQRRIALDRSRISFGWLQAMYSPYRLGTDRHPTGFAVGVTIPVFNRNKNDVARSELNSLEENARLETMKFSVGLAQQERMATLRLQLKQYVNTTTLINDLKQEETEKSHLLARNLDPVSGIRTRVQAMRLVLLQQEIRARILEEWILLLDELDILGQDPLVNFLSEGLETLD